MGRAARRSGSRRQGRARSSSSSRPTLRCSPTNASASRSGPASGSPAPAGPAGTPAATCSSRSPPAIDCHRRSTTTRPGTGRTRCAPSATSSSTGSSTRSSSRPRRRSSTRWSRPRPSSDATAITAYAIPHDRLREVDGRRRSMIRSGRRRSATSRPRRRSSRRTSEPMDWPDLPELGWPYLEHLVARARTSVAVVDGGGRRLRRVGGGRAGRRPVPDGPVRRSGSPVARGRAGTPARRSFRGPSSRMTFSSTDPRALGLYVRAGMRPWWPLLYLRDPGRQARDGRAGRRRRARPTSRRRPAGRSRGPASIARIDFEHYPRCRRPRASSFAMRRPWLPSAGRVANASGRTVDGSITRRSPRMRTRSEPPWRCSGPPPAGSASTTARARAASRRSLACSSAAPGSSVATQFCATRSAARRPGALLAEPGVPLARTAPTGRPGRRGSAMDAS